MYVCMYVYFMLHALVVVCVAYVEWWQQPWCGGGVRDVDASMDRRTFVVVVIRYSSYWLKLTQFLVLLL